MMASEPIIEQYNSNYLQAQDDKMFQIIYTLLIGMNTSCNKSLPTLQQDLARVTNTLNTKLYIGIYL